MNQYIGYMNGFLIIAYKSTSTFKRSQQASKKSIGNIKRTKFGLNGWKECDIIDEEVLYAKPKSA